MMDLGQQLSNTVEALSLGGCSLDEAVRHLRRAFIEQVLRECRGNQCHAARQLGVHRNTLGRYLSTFGIDPSRFYDKGWNRPNVRRPQQSALSFVERSARRSA